MPTIQVETTSGEVKLDPADIDRLTYRIGDEERTIEAPHIAEMFEAYVAASELRQMWEDHRKHVASLDESHRKLSDVLRRQIVGE